MKNKNYALIKEDWDRYLEVESTETEEERVVQESFIGVIPVFLPVAIDFLELVSTAKFVPASVKDTASKVLLDLKQLKTTLDELKAKNPKIFNLVVWGFGGGAAARSTAWSGEAGLKTLQTLLKNLGLLQEPKPEPKPEPELVNTKQVPLPLPSPQAKKKSTPKTIAGRPVNQMFKTVGR